VGVFLLWDFEKGCQKESLRQKEADSKRTGRLKKFTVLDILTWKKILWLNLKKGLITKNSVHKKLSNVGLLEDF